MNVKRGEYELCHKHIFSNNINSMSNMKQHTLFHRIFYVVSKDYYFEYS